MKLSKWQLATGGTLIGVSLIMYVIHYIIFADVHHIVLWSFTSLAFLPISVFFVSMIIGGLLTQRDRRAKLEKMNMVIGAFFTEVGNDFLQMLSGWDDDVRTLEYMLGSIAIWGPHDFAAAGKRLPRNPRTINHEEMDLQEAYRFLNEKRDFLLRLLENPNLLEHEAFTALLRAVLHVAEELGYRDDLSALPDTDRRHISGDFRRAYVLLLQQWLQYMAFIKAAYPYLFSLAVRTNPFDSTASAIVE